MDEQQLACRTAAEYASRTFLTGLQALPVFKPRPGVDLGTLRVSVTLLGHSDLDLGYVDMDPINLTSMGQIASRRGADLHAKQARLTARPSLRLLIGGGA
jgi:hypothetical protein